MSSWIQRAACLVLTLMVAIGCSAIRQLRGPQWTARTEPAFEGIAFNDLADRTALRVLVFGDAGRGSDAQRRVGEAMAGQCAALGGCDLALVTGDNVYPTGLRAGAGGPQDPRLFDRFERHYAAFGRRDFWIVAGNHDWYRRGSIEAQIRYSRHSDRWRMPAQDYAVPGLPDWLRIYALDTTTLTAARSIDQLDRARRWLADGSGWRLVFGHHPVLSSGRHADASGRIESAHHALAEGLGAAGVHIYIAGHDHHQEAITSPAFEQWIQGAGARTRGLRRTLRRSPDEESLHAGTRIGFAIFEADRSKLIVRFFAVDRRSKIAESFCRRYSWDGFSDPPTRSGPCV